MNKFDQINFPFSIHKKSLQAEIDSLSFWMIIVLFQIYEYIEKI